MAQNVNLSQLDHELHVSDVFMVIIPMRYPRNFFKVGGKQVLTNMLILEPRISPQTDFAIQRQKVKFCRPTHPHDQLKSSVAWIGHIFSQKSCGENFRSQHLQIFNKYADFGAANIATNRFCNSAPKSKILPSNPSSRPIKKFCRVDWTYLFSNILWWKFQTATFANNRENIF